MDRRLEVWLFLALVAVIGAAPMASAQSATTGALSGLVSDQSGGVLPGAVVDAVHEPTGTHYSAVLRGDDPIPGTVTLCLLLLPSFLSVRGIFYACGYVFTWERRGLRYNPRPVGA
jgi:hypothetical protein